MLWKSLIFPQDGQHYSALPLQFLHSSRSWSSWPQRGQSGWRFSGAARVICRRFFGLQKNSGVPGLRLPSLGCLCILTHGQGGGLWLVRGDGSGGIFVSGPDGKARGSGSDLLLAGIFRWPGVGLKVV